MTNSLLILNRRRFLSKYGLDDINNVQQHQGRGGGPLKAQLVGLLHAVQYLKVGNAWILQYKCFVTRRDKMIQISNIVGSHAFSVFRLLRARSPHLRWVWDGLLTLLRYSIDYRYQ